MSSQVEQQLEASISEDSLSQDSSSQQGLHPHLSSDQQAQELRLSVERLREFAGTLPQDNLRQIPPCVEEYCDRIGEYRLAEGDCIVALAQRRLNKMLRNRKIKRNWNGEDLTLLFWAVSQRIQQQGLGHFAEMQREDWEFIARLVSGSSWQKCKFRWLGLKKVRLVTHKWSKAESRLLAEAVEQQGRLHWKLVSQLLYERNPARNKAFRTPKQCREHWNCFLNPNIHKGPWQPQEDRRLMEYVLELEGAKKWSEIAKFMAGRTENALKNRFNLLLGAQKRTSGNLTEKRLIRLCLSRLMLEEGQQDHLALHSPIHPTHSPELPEEEAPPSENGSGDPIVPTVGHRPTMHSTMSFQLCYDSPIGFPSLIQQVMGSTYYFGLIYPSQF